MISFCCLKNAFYAHLGRFFYDQEVGAFWSIVNCTLGMFVAMLLFAYALKPWAYRSWRKNLLDNARRRRPLHFEAVEQRIVEFHSLDGGETASVSMWTEIVGLDLKQLLDRLHTGNITARQTLHAYMWKAYEVNQQLNCCVEFLLEAENWAQQLDELSQTDRQHLPLFGLPFSVKENMCIVGCKCTVGLAERLDDPSAVHDASLVQNLRRLGAYPFVRTNVPQTLLSYVCSNPIYGLTENPLRRGLAAGGSSGGEAALVKAGGSIVGIGSDLAGSLRIPASFCGLSVLKPTGSRFRCLNVFEMLPVFSIAVSYGFYARNVETLDFLYSLAMNEHYFQANYNVVPLPWRSVKLPKRLRIGVVLNDGWFEPVASAVRAVQVAQKALEAQGHELVPFEIPNPVEAFKFCIKAILPDGGQYYVGLYQNDPEIDELLKPQYVALRLAQLPILPRLVPKLIKPFWPRLAAIASCQTYSIADLRTNDQQITRYRKMFFEKWTADGLDALLVPAFPFPAVEHRYPAHLFAATFATSLYNVLDVPAGVVPVTKVTANDVEALKTYPLVDRIARLTVESQQGSEGLPVSVQIVTKPFNDELCMKIMEILEKNCTF